MKQTKRVALLIALASLLASAGCTHSIHQLYIGSMDPDASYRRGRWVAVETKHLVILSVTQDSSYVERALAELEAKCRSRLSQVTSEHLTSFKFLSFEQRLILKGWCQE